MTTLAEAASDALTAQNAEETGNTASVEFAIKAEEAWKQAADASVEHSKDACIKATDFQTKADLSNSYTHQTLATTVPVENKNAAACADSTTGQS